MGETGLLSGFWRWWWLIILVALATVGAALLRERTGVPVYESSVEVELSTFSPEDIAAFREVVDREQVRDQTIEELGLQGQRARYRYETKPLGVARVLATFEARSPKLAAEIANTHMALAIEQYSDLRVGPLRAQRERRESRESAAEEAMRAAEDALIAFIEQNDAGSRASRLARLEKEIADLEVIRTRWQAKAATGAPDPLAETEALLAERGAEMERLIALAPEYVLLDERYLQARTEHQNLVNQASKNPGTVPADQIQAAEDELSAAIEALTEFQLENGINNLGKDRSAQQELLEQVKTQRDQLLLSRADSGDDPMGELDQRLVKLYGEADRLSALAPEHNLLTQRAADAQRELSQVRTWLSSAKLEEEEAETAHVIEILRPAEAPSEPAPDSPVQYAIAIGAGLLLGLLLAFSLEYVFAARRERRSGRRAAGVSAASSERAELADGRDRRRVGRSAAGTTPAPSEPAELADGRDRQQPRRSTAGVTPAPSERAEPVYDRDRQRPGEEVTPAPSERAEVADERDGWRVSRSAPGVKPAPSDSAEQADGRERRWPRRSETP